MKISKILACLVWFGVLGVVVGFWACEATPAVGTEGAACYPNNTCNDGLSCNAGTCRKEGGVSDAGTGDGGSIVDNGDPVDSGSPADNGNPVDTGTPTDKGAGPDDKPADAGSPTDKGTVDTPKDDKFSFFVTSLEAMQKLSGSKDGFGGDLGGLEGADRICQTIAAGVGYGHKVWRAFISVTKGPDGKPVNAIERIGQGPWYDRNQRLISKDISGLMGDRPAGDRQAVMDMTNEHGQPQLQFGDNHDTITGSNKQGKLYNTALNTTCQDWTSKVGPGSESKVYIGHSWPRNNATSGRGASWMSDHAARGCSAGVNLKQDGAGTGDCIGCSGGYGGLYCFAVSGETYKDTGTKCTKDADCQSEQRCFIGYCLAKPKAGCSDDSDCPQGKQCRQNETGVACADPPPPCRSNTDCARGERCSRGTCVPGRP